MKNLKLIITVIALSLFVTSATYANETETTSSDQLSSQVAELLGNHPFDEVEEGIEATVSFMLNKEGEIVIVSVDSDSEGVEQFVKEKLNYQKVNTIGLKNGKIYEIPLTLVE